MALGPLVRVPNLEIFLKCFFEVSRENWGREPKNGRFGHQDSAVNTGFDPIFGHSNELETVGERENTDQLCRFRREPLNCCADN